MNQTPNPNQGRADRAGRVLRRDCPDGDPADALTDLLADAMHWCDARAEDFDALLAQARSHHAHELSDDQPDERRADR